MTEYEIAALALAKAEGIRHQIEIVQGAVALIMEANTLFVSFLSGYLAICYFLGEKLSRLQAVSISIFYVLLIVANRAMFWTIQSKFIGAEAQLAVLQGDPVYSGLSPEITMATTCLMALGGLYYMWSQRRQA